MEADLQRALMQRVWAKHNVNRAAGQQWQGRQLHSVHTTFHKLGTFKLCYVFLHLPSTFTLNTKAYGTSCFSCIPQILHETFLQDTDHRLPHSFFFCMWNVACKNSGLHAGVQTNSCFTRKAWMLSACCTESQWNIVTTHGSAVFKNKTTLLQSFIFKFLQPS